MKWWFLTLCIISYLHQIENANILGIFAFPGRSHYVMFEPILKELAKRGHNVDVLSHYPLKKPMERYNVISLFGTQPIFTNNMSMEVLNVAKTTRVETLNLMLNNGGLDVCVSTFNTEAAQNLKNSKKKYDLMITEMFATDCMLGWGYHFDIPVVAATSSVVLPWGNDRFGNPDNPSYIPSFEVNFSPKMNLFQRVVNTFYVITAKIIYYYRSELPSNQLMKNFFGKDIPNLSELTRNISLLLVNSHFSFNQARPTVPNFVEVGGLHIGQPKPLNEHFEKVLQTDSEGVIYFAMGSMVMTETFPFNTIQALFDAFAELPYKVLWKAAKEKFPEGLRFPKNIYFENWMPQLDILCHPNVKLFVSHGGLMGNQEGIYCGVPILGIPLFADQNLNIEQSVAMGIAKKVKLTDITKELVLEAAKELLGNPSYKATAELTSKRFKDRPMSAMDTAIYWIEYVIRHKGAPHLRSTGADLPFYKYHLLDVIAVATTVPLLLGYLLLSIVKYLFSLLRSHKTKSD